MRSFLQLDGTEATMDCGCGDEFMNHIVCLMLEQTQHHQKSL
jgi:hypothetical protein